MMTRTSTLNRTDRVLLGMGLVIPVWLAIGVGLTALAYPGYSHMDHALSRLGAVDAPTQGFSAWINNMPLGVLFVLIGLGLVRRFRRSRLACLSAALILLHGLASFATGFFPCDQGCAPVQPSRSQALHNLAGLMMFLSLTLASALWGWLGRRLLASPGFACFSILCTGMALVTAALMAGAVTDGQGFGLYQRLNYAAGVCWLAVLVWLARRERG
ncbi:putative membrane protein [Pseudomonas sp. SORGH_AS199]|nr:putative membrane protein [Pseudomonas sp. SORGH_AS_0199]